MKHFGIKRLAFLWVLLGALLSGCAPRIVTTTFGDGTKYPEKNSKGPLLHVNSFLVKVSGVRSTSMDRDRIMQEFVSSMLASGNFQDVLVGPRPVGDNVLSINVEVRGGVNLETNWLLAWPALYPAVLVWPLQPYIADVSLSMNVELNGEAPYPPLPFRTVWSETYRQWFYGFYFRGGVSKTVEKGMTLMFDKFGRVVEGESDDSEEGITQGSQGSFYRNPKLVSTTKKVNKQSNKKNLDQLKIPAKVKNMAVVDFKSSDPALGRVVTDKVLEGMIQKQRFKLIEREAMGYILQEQGFQNSGQCDSEQCLVQMGQMLGVDALVTGSISQLGNMYVVIIRLVDVESGEIILAASAETEKGLSDLLSNVLPKLVRSF